jgi:hypothetical protein
MPAESPTQIGDILAWPASTNVHICKASFILQES